MDFWDYDGYARVVALARCDPVYQELLAENRKLEPVYLGIMEKLNEHEREVIDGYIASCENLEHRLTQLAYECGRCRFDKK